MYRTPLLVLIFILSLLAPAAAMAAQGPELKSDQPIHVVSDSLEVDNKAQVANFIGAVKATQGDVTILCDKLEVYYDQKKDQAAAPKKDEKADGGDEAEKGLMDGGGSVKRVVALGHVKVTQKDRVAVGQKATYWAGGRKILLEGQATVWRGRNQVSGEKITVFLDKDRSVVHGKPGKRVSVTIVPEQQQKKK